MSSSDPSPSTTGHKRVYTKLTDDTPSDQADRCSKRKLSSEKCTDDGYESLILKRTRVAVLFPKIKHNTRPRSSSSGLVSVTKADSSDSVLAFYSQGAFSNTPRHNKEMSAAIVNSMREHIRSRRTLLRYDMYENSASTYDLQPPFSSPEYSYRIVFDDNGKNMSITRRRYGQEEICKTKLTEYEALVLLREWGVIHPLPV